MQRFWYTRLITRADQGLLDELFRGAKDKEHAALKEGTTLEAELIQKDAEALELLTKNMVIGSDEWKETKEILARTIEREKEGHEGNNTTVKSSAWQKLMNLLMQLRKVCNHPYQIPNAEPVPYELGDHIIRASGKFIVLEKLIAELVVKQRKKILIFSGFTKMLDLVEEFLLINGGDGTSYRSVRLDGSTARARRNLGIKMFNDNSSDYRVMLISTRAGGLGINLATASDVVMLDQDWNPQITLQAEARAHRIGQTKPVTVYKLVSQGTVEEQMMGRIQKKLYLSAKVTESMQDIHTKAGKIKKGPGGRVVADDDMPQLSTGQLMALVRRGASALSKPEVDVNEMLSWDWETIVAKCKDQPADINVKKDAIPDAIVDQEAEKKWLSEMEKVESYIFEGKKFERSNGRGAASTKDIAGEWNRADRRIGKNTTVMVDGFAINKESMQCKDWEAVPTMAGKDPRLAEPKRAKKAEVISQSHCQVCLDGGELHICKLCPRSYHYACLDREFKAKTKAWQFVCPQHQCNDCEQKTTDAGGMLYRCRWCERAFCEDCLDWDKTQLIGETLIEYELLNYPAVPQAFYIQCHACTDHFVENLDDQAVCARMASEMEKEYERVFATADSASQVGSLTDAATIETTGVNTPIVIDDDFELPTSKKRKLQEGENHLRLSFKREKLEPDLPAHRNSVKRETALEGTFSARRRSLKREDLKGSSPACRSFLKHK
jgi:SWI/SNF-related matrix-associated actin-dependent regulator of chromatin subfamily A member 5